MSFLVKPKPFADEMVVEAEIVDLQLISSTVPRYRSSGYDTVPLRHAVHLHLWLFSAGGLTAFTIALLALLWSAFGFMKIPRLKRSNRTI